MIKVGWELAPEAEQKSSSQPNKESLNSERQKLKHFKLKIDEILTPDSKIPALQPRAARAGTGTKKQLSKDELRKVEKTKAKLERRKAGPEPVKRKAVVDDPWAAAGGLELVG
jgi:hypothetical protein